MKENVTFERYIKSLLDGDVIQMSENQFEVFGNYVEAKGLEQAFEHIDYQYSLTNDEASVIVVLWLQDMVDSKVSSLDRMTTLSKVSELLESYGAGIFHLGEEIIGHEDYIGYFIIKLEEKPYGFLIKLELSDDFHMDSFSIKDFESTLEYINKKKRFHHA